MKRRLIAVLLVVMLLSASGVATADLLFIPPDNAFLEAHKAECVETSAVYEATADARLYDKPDGAPVAYYEPGDTFDVLYIWQDAWGIDVMNTGWIRLSDFRRLYDEGDFMRDHRAELLDVSGEMGFDAAGIRCAWEMPSGSVDPAVAEVLEAFDGAGYPIVTWTFPGSGEMAFSYDDYFEIGTVPIGPLYRDGEGRLWGRAEHYSMNVWICLSQPSDVTLPCTAPRYAEEAVDLSSAKQKQVGMGSTSDAPGPGGPSCGIAAAAVILVMLITGLLLRRLQNSSRPVKAKRS